MTPAPDATVRGIHDVVFLVALISPALALPDTDPKITGGRPRYQIGDIVRVNCTSGRSKPAAKLTWFINGEVAEPSIVRRYDTVITGREGLETTVLGLEFRVRLRHFKRGDMKLKVSALTTCLLGLVGFSAGLKGMM